MTILETITKIIAHQGDLAPEKIQPETKLGDLFDSLDRADLAWTVEKTFDIRIPDDASPETVADLVALVETSKAAETSAAAG